MAALTNMDLYDALLAAGAPEAKARAAATSVTDVNTLDAKVDKLAWMVGVSLTLNFATFAAVVGILLKGVR